MYHGWVTVVKRNYDSHRFFYEFLSHGRVLHPPSSPSTESQFYYSFSLYTCPLLKKSSGNPYLKILDFSQLFITDAPMKKRIQFFCFTPAQNTFGTPNSKIFKKKFPLIKKSFLKTLVDKILRFH